MTRDFYFNLEEMNNQKQDLVERYAPCRCKHPRDEHCALDPSGPLLVHGTPLHSECLRCPCPEFRPT